MTAPRSRRLATAPPSPAEGSPGARLGPYEITGAMGAGGMGEVFRARDTKLNRDVPRGGFALAIKVLPAAFADDPERLARFTREAQTLASLNHPNIATIHGIEEIASSASSADLVAMTKGVGVGAFSAAAGLLAYRTDAGTQRQLTWVDRSGTARGTVGDPDGSDLLRPRVAPDGRRVLLDRVVQGNRDLWLLGQTWNASSIGSAMGLSDKTVRSYLDILPVRDIPDLKARVRGRH